MYIVVSGIQANPNPSSLYLTFTVVSAAGTNTTEEAFADDEADAATINEIVAEAARQRCRQNGESVDAGALVTIFGGAVQV